MRDRRLQVLRANRGTTRVPQARLRCHHHLLWLVRTPIDTVLNSFKVLKRENPRQHNQLWFWNCLHSFDTSFSQIVPMLCVRLLPHTWHALKVTLQEVEDILKYSNQM